MDMNPEVEYYIGRNVSWLKLPIKIKEIFGNAQKGYEKAVVSYSIRNQLRFSDNLIKHIRKDEPKYYEEVIAYSKDKLMLYPYHLSDRIVKGLRITPFQYYTSVMEKIMEQEKSYDSLPNFTAADCLRLLGIGRNQYIELMNQHRSSRKLFRRKPPRELLPAKPIDIAIDPWFVAHHGYVTEEDVVACKPNERKIIDFLIDNGGQGVGSLDYECIHSLYRKGLIYIDVPIESDDYIVVPPLEGFVMNRVLGDYFETLLYKIFVSIDEHTSVGELAKVLDIDAQLIKNAVSLYCRLGFAYKKNLEIDFNTLDASWRKYQNHTNSKNRASYIAPEESLIADELKSALSAESDSSSSEINALPTSRTTEFHSNTNTTSDHSLFYGTHSGSFIGSSKRIAFLYDSTLTAFLMMGNLSPGLKNHAVTMFEVGKMADESLDSFLSELENVSWNEGEGEAQRYFEHAKTLRKTILFLRNNPAMESMSIDLLRCESLLNLDSHTCSRLLNKNYELLVSMAPLSYEVKAVCCESLPHFGPAIPQVNSIWFKLFLYSITNSGPTSLLLSKGTLLNELPSELEDCEKYLVTSWGHDSGIIPGANALFTVNEALSHSAVLVQAYGSTGESSTVIVPFPFGSSRNSRCSTDGTGDDSTNAFKSSTSSQIYTKWAKHPAIIRLSRVIDLEKNCGYITMMNIRGSSSAVDSHNNQNVHKAQANLPLSNMSNKLTNVTEDVVRESQSETDGELIMDDDDEEDHVYVSGYINPEPRNGFKDDQCAKLYQEELDNELILSSSQEELSTVKVKPKAFDSRQQKIESLRLDLNLSEADNPNRSSMSSSVSDAPKSINRKMKSEDKVWFDDWTLLDCQFGIPLFDCGVNQIVCERMLSNGLWQEKSLEYLVKSNNELGKQLAGFINSYQAPNIWNEEIPLPSKNFYCHNGRLQEFEP